MVCDWCGVRVVIGMMMWHADYMAGLYTVLHCMLVWYMYDMVSLWYGMA